VMVFSFILLLFSHQFNRKERFATKKELEQMKRLGADAATLFPAEFHAINPQSIRREFRRREKEEKKLMENS